MPRFSNSNRHAADHMNYIAKRKTRHQPVPPVERCYYRRIGFDFAMI